MIMCGRIFIFSSVQDIEKEFGIDVSEIDRIKPSYNVAPSQDVPVVTNGTQLVLSSMRWGLVPHWAKEEKIGYKMINARAETLTTKPAYREPFKQRRCLIVVDGFYEWKKQGTAKQPYAFETGKPFSLAGLWDEWKQPNNKPLRTCTIVTTDANKLMEPIHNRMPVIVQKKDREQWLDPGASTEELQALLKPYPAHDLELFKVSDKVNSPKNDSPDNLKPI